MLGNYEKQQKAIGDIQLDGLQKPRGVLLTFSQYSILLITFTKSVLLFSAVHAVVKIEDNVYKSPVVVAKHQSDSILWL